MNINKIYNENKDKINYSEEEIIQISEDILKNMEMKITYRSTFNIKDVVLCSNIKTEHQHLIFVINAFDQSNPESTYSKLTIYDTIWKFRVDAEEKSSYLDRKTSGLDNSIIRIGEQLINKFTEKDYDKLRKSFHLKYKNLLYKIKIINNENITINATYFDLKPITDRNHEKEI
ncbi:hypothetical protein U3516DRAFT_740501 [Neocallimastix sp. 'constans']